MISVIIPVYNGEKYIDNIMNDLSKQILRNFEVIFVDDGSKDASYKLLISKKECSNYFFDIKVIRQQNKGVSSARNTGLENAKGEYICFVDVDDGLSSEYLSFMYYVIQKTKASIVFCKTTSSINNNDNNSVLVKKYSNIEALKRFLFFDLVSGVCSLMVSADVINNNRLRFAEGYKYSEDLHMVWKLLFYSDMVVETDKRLYIYNINEGSAMSKFGESRMDSLYLMKDLQYFFEKNSPEFYPLFKRYGQARMAWSLLWQAAYNYDYNKFKEYTVLVDFKNYLKKLFTYKQKHVALSSLLFCISNRAYYLLVKIKTRKFRSDDRL